MECKKNSIVELIESVKCPVWGCYAEPGNACTDGYMYTGEGSVTERRFPHEYRMHAAILALDSAVCDGDG